jgi:hypothetical protein
LDLDLQQQINNSVRESIQRYLETADIEKMVTDSLQQHVNNLVVNTSNRMLASLLGNRDLEREVDLLVGKIVSDHVAGITERSVAQHIANIDLTKVARDVLANETAGLITEYRFPDHSIPYTSIDFSGYTLNASQITSGQFTSFASSGINDRATGLQLDIDDTGVVVVNNISSENLLINDNTFTNNLFVEGIMNITGVIADSDALTSYVTEVADSRIKQHDLADIDLTGRQITDQGKPVLTADSLGSQITNSNLRRVGNLTELTVSGQAIIAETLMVNQGSIGINTEETRGVLTAWDEDAEFSLTKVAQRTMYAGSTRNTDVVLGSNNHRQITLKNTNEIEITGSIRFNGIKINVQDQVPEHTGEPGEIAITRTDGSIYRCLGQNTWRKIT